jgi:hypothetical protein
VIASFLSPAAALRWSVSSINRWVCQGRQRMCEPLGMNHVHLLQADSITLRFLANVAHLMYCSCLYAPWWLGCGCSSGSQVS